MLNNDGAYNRALSLVNGSRYIRVFTPSGIRRLSRADAVREIENCTKCLDCRDTNNTCEACQDVYHDIKTIGRLIVFGVGDITMAT